MNYNSLISTHTGHLAVFWDTATTEMFTKVRLFLEKLKSGNWLWVSNVSSSSNFGCAASLPITVIFQTDNISSTNAVLGIALILGVGVSNAVALGWQVLCADRTWKAKPDLVDVLCQPCGKPHPAPRMWPKFQETDWNVKLLHPVSLLWMTGPYCWVSCIWVYPSRS